ncbi:MAG TPA: hypothetical protein VJM32_03470 [Candidatus Saccharimonadales bacterium]|nr:hypothetical protein [Candidatus Saccharimonadales bacterium]
MSVLSLPHDGDLLSIDLYGRQTLFGFTTSGKSIRPASQPCGEPWPDFEDGWRRYDSRVASTIAAMLEANANGKTGDEVGPFWLDVSPEVAAQLRASNIYTVTDLMRYTETTVETVDGEAPAIVIPLPSKPIKSGDDDTNANVGYNWYQKGGVRVIRVSSAFQNAAVVDASGS